MKKSTPTKFLCMFLSLLMAFSAFGVLTPVAFAEGTGSVTDAMWNALADALRSDNVKNSYGNGNDVEVDDRTGDVTAAAKAYFAVFNAYVHKATSGGKQSNQNEYNLGYRTSQQVRDLVKNKMQSLMGADFDAYGVAGVLNKLGGPTVSDASNSKQNSVPTTSFTVKVTNMAGLLNYATLDEAENVPTYSYTISHRNDRYYESTSGCDTVNNYYAVVSTASETNGLKAVDISALRALETAFNDNADLLNADRDAKIAMGYDALSAAFSTITTTKTAAESAFNATMVTHFFAAELEKLDALEAAMKIAQYAPYVDRINEYVATDISAFDRAALTEIYESLKADYNSYKAINIDDVYTYFETETGALDRSAVDAKYAEIEDAYQRAYLNEVVKPDIDASVEEYQSYDDDWVLATDHADVAIAAAGTALDGYEETLGQYKSVNVDAVFGAGYAAETFGALRAEFDRLIEVNEWKETFAQYKSVYTAAFEPVTPDYSTDQLYSVLNSHDAWYTDLQAYVAAVNEYDALLAGKILTDLEAAMETKIDSVYAMLNARIEATINNAYDLYQGFVAEYGYSINTADDVSVSNYTALRAAFGLLNPDHYDFLTGTAHFTVADETVAKYEEIRDAVFAFVNFDASKGLSAYKFNHAEVEDIIRAVSSKDYARNADYDVTDEKVEAIIDILEELLASDNGEGEVRSLRYHFRRAG